jgi:peptide-methionine (S)-S-oxide reductase
MFSLMKDRLARIDEALPGRNQPIEFSNKHFVLGTPLRADFPGCQRVQFGMGCFWGAEKRYWGIEGVATTATGYAGGYTPNPNYREVCTGLTSHAEVVLVVYDPVRVSFANLLKVFWESHDPTQGLRQGNDVGSQYRSAIYCDTQAQFEAARESALRYSVKLSGAGYGAVTTEIKYPAPTFYYAEDYHQQYLAKNPAGYCGIGGTGVACPIGTSVRA